MKLMDDNEIIEKVLHHLDFRKKDNKRKTHRTTEIICVYHNHIG